MGSLAMNTAAPVVPLSELGAAEQRAEQMLPVREELSTVLPWPGLRRGSTVVVEGSETLLSAMLAEATTHGSWAALVGFPHFGLVAASEMGVDLARLALIPEPGREPASVLSALLDGVDVLVLHSVRLSDSVARRLATRARHRGTVLVPFESRSRSSWPQPDLRLGCDQSRWRGLGHGHGYLRERLTTVWCRGRGASARAQSTALCLPNATGNLSSPPHPSSGGTRARSLAPVAG